MDGLEGGRLVRLEGRDHDPAHGDRVHSRLAQRLDEARRWRLGQDALAPGGGLVDDAAVLRHHPVEEV